MAEAPIRRRVVVHGRVQGVFFRDTVRRLAESRGVAGWARNTAEGTVETVLEGPADAVSELVAFCEQGPARAAVERIEVAEEPPEGLRGFSTA